jgi:alpha-galactosidase
MLLGSSPGAVFSLQPAQSRTQFNLWCIMAAPLLIGSSLLDMTAFDLETYTNKEAIAVSQDPRGQQGFVVWSDCPLIPIHKVPRCAQIWARALSYNKTFALAFVNFADFSQPRTVRCQGVCIRQACGVACVGRKLRIRDIWGKKESEGDSVEASLSGGASAMFVVTPIISTKRVARPPSPVQNPSGMPSMELGHGRDAVF